MICKVCNSDMIKGKKYWLCEECGAKEIIINQEWYETLAEEFQHLSKDKIDNMPEIFAYQIKQLIHLTKHNEIYGVMLQIKDLAEMLIKFPVLIIAAKTYHKTNKSIEEIEFLTSLLKKLSMGAWVNLSRKIPKDNSREYIFLKEVIDIYNTDIKINGELFNIVKWRNETIGHGALRLKDDEFLINEIKQIAILVLKGVLKMVNMSCKLSIEIKNSDMYTALSGGTLVGEKAFTEDLTVEIEGKEIQLYPYILLYKGEICFYDTIIFGKHKKVSVIDYRNGYSYKLIMDVFSVIHNSLNHEKMSNKTDVIHSDLMDAYLSATKPGNYEEPKYLFKWLNDNMNVASKGVFYLEMPRGTGKSAFASSLDGLKSTKNYLGSDVRCRSYYIDSSMFFNVKYFISGIYSILTQNPDNTNMQYGVMGMNMNIDNPSIELAKLMNNVQLGAKELYGEKKLLLVIDGLDEIPLVVLENKNKVNILDLLPSSNLLNDNVFILLTSRNDDDIEEEIIKKQLGKIKSKADFYMSFDKKGKAYNDVLISYAEKKLKSNESIDINKVIQQCDYRFVHLKLYCAIYGSKGFNNKDTDLIQVLLNNLRADGGEKYLIKIKYLLATFCFHYKPITIEEIAELSGIGTINLSLLSLLHDVEGLLKKERVSYGTVYSLSNEEYRNKSLDICKSELGTLISTWEDQLLYLVNDLSEFDVGTVELLILSKICDIIDFSNKGSKRKVSKLKTILDSTALKVNSFENRELNLYLATLYQLVDRAQYFEDDFVYAVHIHLCDLLLMLGDYSQCGYYVNKAENLIEKKATLFSSFWFKLLDIKARLYFRLGNYIESEKLYYNIIDLKSIHYGSEHIETIRSKFKYAIMGHEFNLSNSREIVEKTYNEVLITQEKLLGKLNAETAWTLNNIADVSWINGKMSDSKEQFHIALEIRKKLYGEKSPEVAWTMNLLASLNYSLGNIIEAQSQYEESISIRKKTLGPNHVDIAWSLTDYSKVYMGKKLYSEAEEIMLNAAEIYEKNMGVGHPYTATVINNLGVFYKELGEYDRAYNYLSKSLNIKKRSLRAGHPYIANSLNNIACLLIDRNSDLNMAEKYLWQALTVYENELIVYSIDNAIIYNNLLVLNNKKGNINKIEKLLTKIELILNNFENSSHMVSIKINDNITKYGYIYRVLQDKKGLAYYPSIGYNNHSEILDICNI